MAATSQRIQEPYSKFKSASFDFWGGPVGKHGDGTYFAPGFYMQGDTNTHACAYLKDVYSTLLISLEGPLSQNQQAQTPGLARVVVKKGTALDMKKPAGADGERATFHGLSCGRVEIYQTIWTPEQLNQLRLLWALIQPPAGKGTPPAFKCRHPELTSQNISALQFYEIEGPTEGPTKRAKTYLIHAVEFLQPATKSSTKTPVKPLSTTLDPKVAQSNGKNPQFTGPKS